MATDKVKREVNALQLQKQKLLDESTKEKEALSNKVEDLQKQLSG